MTNEQLNRAIHEWMGRGEWVSQEVEYCEKCGVEGITEIGSPDYTKDHDAFREFLQAVWEANQNVEAEWIALNFYEAFNQEGEDGEMLKQFAFITPRQLAEAGAKAVGIWKEQNQ